MTSLTDIVLSISERTNLSALTNDQQTAIEQLYTELLNKPFVRRAGCSDCYRDALIEIKIKLKHSQMKYSLKKGALVFNHVDNNYYTDANLTDIAAEQVLSASPSLISQFAVFPKDWQKEKAPTPAAEPSSHEIKDGGIIRIDAQGKATDEQGAKIKPGKYLTADGGTVVVSTAKARYEAPTPAAEPSDNQ